MIKNSSISFQCLRASNWPSFHQCRVGLAVSAFAYLTVASSAVCAQQFTEVTTQVGFVNEAKKSWGNPIWGDVNNDGFLDLIVPTHGLAVSHGPFVYLNNGGTSFTDNRDPSGIKRAPELESRDWHGLSFFDFDGDGKLDVYISEGAKGKQGGIIKRDLLYQGQGDGTFKYISNTAGLVSSTDRGRCSFAFDYDNDGKLDLFVKNYGSVNQLYRNNGDGTFTNVAAGSGLDKATQGRDVGSICSFADYDNDGFMDVAFSGDGTADSLYRNQGDGTFVDVSAAAGMGPGTSGKGLAWGDYDNDGFVDLYVTRGAVGTGSFSNTLYHNNGNGTFSDVSAAAGVAATTNTWSAVWGDYDNNGFLDLFVTSAGPSATGPGNANFLYYNNGDGTFTNKAAAEGIELQDNVSLHKGSAFVDYDNDGFLDLTLKDGVGNEREVGPGSSGLHRLFRNTATHANQNHFIKVNLQGVQSNLRGIGARVSVTSTNGFSYRQNTGGGGGDYASQGSQPLHFGIGSAAVGTVVVTWPSGVVDTLPSVPDTSSITVIEGSSP